MDNLKNTPKIFLNLRMFLEAQKFHIILPGDGTWNLSAGNESTHYTCKFMALMNKKVFPTTKLRSFASLYFCYIYKITYYSNICKN